jgi:hypothetical protein
MNYDLDTDEGMANAIAWTQRHFKMAKDFGLWMVPRSGTLVRFDNAEKAAIITPGHTPDPSIARVIKAMGWTVTEK